MCVALFFFLVLVEVAWIFDDKYAIVVGLLFFVLVIWICIYLAYAQRCEQQNATVVLSSVLLLDECTCEQK